LLAGDINDGHTSSRQNQLLQRAAKMGNFKAKGSKELSQNERPY